MAVATISVSAFEENSAACEIKTSSTQGEKSLTVSLSADCTEAERERHALDAFQLIDAFKRSKDVDLSDVMIRGDLLLDVLAAVPIPPDLKKAATIESEDVRIVQKTVSIVN